MKNSLSTDNICLLAILGLDARPSSVCVTEVSPDHLLVEVLRSEFIGRNATYMANRFSSLLKASLSKANLGHVKVDLRIVDSLSVPFEEQIKADLSFGSGARK